MVFSSVTFLFLFFPFVLIGYFLIPKKRLQGRNLFLFAVSSFFYFWGEQKMIFMMYGMILLNYSAVLCIVQGSEALRLEENGRRTRRQKGILYLTMLLTLGSLGYYKYLNFGIANVNAVLAGLHIPREFQAAADIALPLGISFYTFHILSYTLDVYAGRLQAEKNILRLATYIMMFPQLIAGPIVRYIDVQKQFCKRSVTRSGFANGSRRFMIGLAKKVLIANTVARAADGIFALPPEAMTMALAWLGAVCYTLQIYFDFSGYSDMALGIGRMFGFHYKENFIYPYISQSIGEFWRRWHISLSSWLRDYVYIAFGGSRTGRLRTYRNLFIVLVLSGLWHGASWNFVLWGAWYGLFVMLEKMGLKKILERSWRPLRHVYVLLIVMLGWVVFRAEDMPKAFAYLGLLFGQGGSGPQARQLTEFLQFDVALAVAAGLLASCNLAAVYRYRVWSLAKRAERPAAVFAAYKALSFGTAFVLFLLSVMGLAGNTYNPFIYFRF